MKIPWDKIEKTDTCWNWTGSLNGGGYGDYCTKGKTYRAHRYVYEALVGKIPKGLCIDHLCRNRKCVNPKHLEVVTSRENILRGIGLPAKNFLKTHCIRGHEFTPENTYLRKGRLGYRNNDWRVCKKCIEFHYLNRKKVGLKQWIYITKPCKICKIGKGTKEICKKCREEEYYKTHKRKIALN